MRVALLGKSFKFYKCLEKIGISKDKYSQACMAVWRMLALSFKGQVSHEGIEGRRRASLPPATHQKREWVKKKHRGKKR